MSGGFILSVLTIIGIIIAILGFVVMVFGLTALFGEMDLHPRGLGVTIIGIAMLFIGIVLGNMS